MTRNCTSQSCTVSRIWIGSAYDGSSEDLRVELVSQVSCKWFCFVHSTHEDHLLP